MLGFGKYRLSYFVRHTLGLCYLPRHKICKTKQILLFALYRNNQHLSWARNGWLGNITHLGYAAVKSVFSCHVLLWIMLVVLPFGENEITLTKEKHFIVCTVFDIFHQTTLTREHEVNCISYVIWAKHYV